MTSALQGLDEIRAAHRELPTQPAPIRRCRIRRRTRRPEVTEQLRAAGCEVRTEVGGTGIVGAVDEDYFEN